jgi:hypothetical protein
MMFAMLAANKYMNKHNESAAAISVAQFDFNRNRTQHINSDTADKINATIVLDKLPDLQIISRFVMVNAFILSP